MHKYVSWSLYQVRVWFGCLDMLIWVSRWLYDDEIGNDDVG